MCAEIKMTMPKEYFKPKSIKEAVTLLQNYGSKAQVLSGATDLFSEKEALRETIIDISEAGLDYINFHDDDLKIGACTTFSNLIGALHKGPFKLIAEAARQMGTPQVRNIATIGGNLCNASPSADLAPPLYVLEAKLKLTGPNGSREVAIDDFFMGPGKTALKPEEILEEIHVPPIRGERMVTSFDKVKRIKGKDLAVVNGAVAVAFDNDKKCNKVRICLGAVGPTPIRAKAAEKLIEGKQLSDDLIEQAARKAAESTEAIDDVRASAAYRKYRSYVLIRRALEKVAKSIER